MFKMLPPTFLAVPVAWLAIFLLIGLNAVSPSLKAIGLSPTNSWVVLVIQGVVALFFLTPAWKLFWKLVPPLNRWFYPDLSGEWIVELESNFSRIEAILDAAMDPEVTLDMRLCPSDALPPLQTSRLRAKITQGWVSMDMEVWNPDGDGPIKQSDTIVVEPFRGRQGKHGLAYIFEQQNETDTPSDTNCFKGAAWIVRDREDPNVLHGRMWNDRMWRRGMNTAANVRLTRATPWRSFWERPINGNKSPETA